MVVDIQSNMNLPFNAVRSAGDDFDECSRVIQPDASLGTEKVSLSPGLETREHFLSLAFLGSLRVITVP